MKKIVTFILCLLVISYSCKSTKRSEQNLSKNKLSVQGAESQSTKTERLIDTTRAKSGKITITEIEFYPPTIEPEKDRPDDAAPEQGKPPASNAGGIDLPNAGKISHAAIKSIRQTTIESGMEQKGESKETSETSGNQSKEIIASSERRTQREAAPAPDPYRWRYVFYIVVIVSTGILYFKRIPILNWIKKILSGIRRIF